MDAVSRVPFGPWHWDGLKLGGQLLRPSPTVKKRFSSISVGTRGRLRLRKFLAKAVTVAVSLKAGREGNAGGGALAEPLVGQAPEVAVVYWRMAVAVVLSKGAFWAL